MAGTGKRERIAAICWIAMGAIILVWSATFPFGRWDAPGPAIFPLIISVVLILLGIILLVKTRKITEEEPAEKVRSVLPRGAALMRVALTLAGMFIAALLLDRLGFLVTFFCLILFLVRAVQPESLKKDVLYAFVFTLAAYGLFQVLLKTTLPRGILGF